MEEPGCRAYVLTAAPHHTMYNMFSVVQLVAPQPRLATALNGVAPGQPAASLRAAPSHRLLLQYVESVAGLLQALIE
jgi:hypothetical protein